MNPIHATERYAGHHAEAAYSRWAPVYDLIFDLPFHPGRLAAARAAGSAAGPAARFWSSASAPDWNCPCCPATCW